MHRIVSSKRLTNASYWKLSVLSSSGISLIGANLQPTIQQLAVVGLPARCILYAYIALRNKRSLLVVFGDKPNLTLRGNLVR